jgi:predicted nucleic acid-binding protein
MLYVLDTNILSAMRFDPSLVSAGDVATTSFNLSEILYGALRRPDLADVQSFARFVVETIPVLDFDSEAAAWYAKKRHELNFVKPNVDAMIAAVAVVHDATLVTRNVRHFPFEELNVVTRC